MLTPMTGTGIGTIGRGEMYVGNVFEKSTRGSSESQSIPLDVATPPRPYAAGVALIGCGHTARHRRGSANGRRLEQTVIFTSARRELPEYVRGSTRRAPGR